IIDSLFSHDLSVSTGTVLFEMTRRVPGAGLVVGLLALSEITKHFALAEAPANSPLLDSEDLPLLASQINWISAAGNYVELHGVEKPVLHRAPISMVERALADHGFVRVHRSVLVSRRAIASVAKGLVTLKCGRTFKIGNRYRSALDQIG
ncbi:LytTR family DNA-binding domain-containing protein, partial [Parasphingorhabdus sp.]